MRPALEARGEDRTVPGSAQRSGRGDGVEPSVGAKPTFLHPFRIDVDPMQGLLLLNLDKDPDDVYAAFEPQVFDDDVHGRGVIVVAWRRDGRVDVYHPSAVRLDPATYSIAGDGLHAMVERSFERARFDLSERGVDADVCFDDAAGRRVELRVVERSTRPAPRFGLLAPMGDAARAPEAMPLLFLRAFAFVRRAGSEVRVAVDGREHAIAGLPVPIDGQRMLFARYAISPLIATLNPNHDGALAPVSLGDAGAARDDALELDVREHEGRAALVALTRRHGGQAITLRFDGPYPDVRTLREREEIAGRFSVAADPRAGDVSGSYSLRRDGDVVSTSLHPDRGWRPNERRWSLRLVYRLAPVFRRWPRTYRWDAEIDLTPGSAPAMRSRWTRLDRS